MEIENNNSDLDFDRLKQIVEAVLFSADQPVTAKKLIQILELEDKMLLTDIIEDLQTEYNKTRRSFQIIEVANGFQILTRPEYASYVEKLYGKSKKYRLTRSALETLAIIAYKQPITMPLLEKIRGVDSRYLMNKLLEYDLIKILGRSEKPGRPLLIGTTENFLQYFGLKKLSDMPKLEEIGGVDQFEEDIIEETSQEELPFTPDYGDDQVDSVEQQDKPDQVKAKFTMEDEESEADDSENEEVTQELPEEDADAELETVTEDPGADNSETEEPTQKLPEEDTDADTEPETVTEDPGEDKSETEEPTQELPEEDSEAETDTEPESETEEKITGEDS